MPAVQELEGAAPAPASRKAGPTLEQQRARTAWLFVAPMLAAVALVAAWPLARTIAFSFTDAYLDNLDSWQVIGFANYVALFQDPLWWSAVGTTLLFAIASVGLETLLGVFFEIRRSPVNAPIHHGKIATAFRVAGFLEGPLALALRLFWDFSPAGRYSAAICFLAGSLLSRYAWIWAGRVSTHAVKTQFAAQREGQKI